MHGDKRKLKLKQERFLADGSKDGRPIFIHVYS